MVGNSASDLVALGDLDGDNNLDAVVGDQIWMNDGLGTFTDSGQELIYGATNLPLGMWTAMSEMQLSARAYHRVLKLSRTIADLAGKVKLPPNTWPRRSSTG